MKVVEILVLLAGVTQGSSHLDAAAKENILAQLFVDMIGELGQQATSLTVLESTFKSLDAFLSKTCREGFDLPTKTCTQYSRALARQYERERKSLVERYD
jgi:hypothetical protein